MSSEVVVKWFGDTFGGTLYTNVPEGNKRQFSWMIRGPHVETVLRPLLPYLKEKRRRAELAIEIALMIHPQKGGKKQRLTDIKKLRRTSIAAQIKAYNRNPEGEVA